jgi:long-chain acyl-CoA synthetase
MIATVPERGTSGLTGVEGGAAAETAVVTTGEGWATASGEVESGTLAELFLRAADEFDKTDAAQYRTADGWKSISHRQIMDRVHRISDALVADGVARGDRVAILSENRPEWALADYALLCMGALNVPIYPSLPADQMVYSMRHAEIAVAFVSTADQLAKVLEVRREWSGLRRIVMFDDVASDEAGVITLEQFEALAADAATDDNEFRRRAREAKPSDVATLVYTSGTTGTPKGVMLTNENLVTNVNASLSGFPISSADVALSFLPLSHVFQRIVDYVMFSYGVTIAYVESFDDVSRSFTEVHPTIAVSVPRVYEKVYARVLSEKGLKRQIVLWSRRIAIAWAEATLSGRTPGAWLRFQHRLADRLVYAKLRDRMGGRIRFFISGGAPLSPSIAEFFLGAGLMILEGYGLTETSPVTNLNTPTHMRIGTVGRPIRGTEIRIAGDGEILVRGPQVMRGYYRNEDATREVIDDDGWFHTGDIGEIDADGFLRITDRKKELLKTAGGKYIAPQPLENEIKRSRFVSEAVVLGDRRPYPIAIVVPNFDNLRAWAHQHGIREDSAEALVYDRRVVEKLEQEVLHRVEGFARYEQPKKVLALTRELSLNRGEITPTLKVKRRVVEEHNADRIEALYAEPSPAEG